MKTWISLIATCAGCFLQAEIPFVYPHETIKEFSMHGNTQKGVATKSMGAKEFEVWRASIAVGSKTPRHVHESEEVFIVLRGEILAIVGDQKIHCKAPATLICPANIPHQLINVGNEPTDQLLVVRVDSKISDASGNEMQLPWRQ